MEEERRKNRLFLCLLKLQTERERVKIKLLYDEMNVHVPITFMFKLIM